MWARWNRLSLRSIDTLSTAQLLLVLSILILANNEAGYKTHKKQMIKMQNDQERLFTYYICQEKINSVFYARNVVWKAKLLSHHLPGTSLILHFMQLFLARFIVRRSWDGRRQSQLEELISWNAENHCFGGLPSAWHHQMHFAEKRTTCLFWPWLVWGEIAKSQGIQLDKEHLQRMFC